MRVRGKRQRTFWVVSFKLEVVGERRVVDVVRSTVLETFGVEQITQ